MRSADRQQLQNCTVEPFSLPSLRAVKSKMCAEVCAAIHTSDHPTHSRFGRTAYCSPTAGPMSANATVKKEHPPMSFGCIAPPTAGAPSVALQVVRPPPSLSQPAPSKSNQKRASLGKRGWPTRRPDPPTRGVSHHSKKQGVGGYQTHPTCRCDTAGQMTSAAQAGALPTHQNCCLPFSLHSHVQNRGHTLPTCRAHTITAQRGGAGAIQNHQTPTARLLPPPPQISPSKTKLRESKVLNMAAERGHHRHPPSSLPCMYGPRTRCGRTCRKAEKRYKECL